MAQNPKTWDEYERGGAGSPRGSVGSLGNIHFDEDAEREHLLRPHRHDSHGTQHLRQRRSSMTLRINALAQYGGVNSIENFARSWQRAVAFHDVVPVRSSFTVADSETVPQEYDRVEPTSPTNPRSILGQQLSGSRIPSEIGISTQDSPLLSPHANPLSPGHDIFANAHHIGSPFASSYGATWGTAKTSEAARETAAKLFLEQQETGTQEPDGDREPLLLKRVEDTAGHVGIEVIGQSTVYQTILNSTNVLIGVGLLTLPLGIRYAGWIFGISFLTISAATTAYTARLLGKCLEIDKNLITFSDLAYVAFGYRGQILIGVTFTLELMAACVALIVLFADSLNLLIPGWGLLEFKILAGLIMIPLCFVPLRYLGYTSSLGIISCLTIVIIVIIDGLIKPDYPGSLREPAATYLFPENWATLPLSLGLLMSPWGGHAVFPNIYRDMRHPHRYAQSLKVTFGFTFGLDASIAVVGLLMFGDKTREEITQNIFLTKGYPPILSILIAICIAIIPITKLPLNARPILTTVEHMVGLSTQDVSGMSPMTRGFARACIRALVVVVITVIAIVCPSFDRVMALMGSAFCFTICIVMPALFYIRLYGKEISRGEKILDYVLVVVCSVLAIIGTVWAFVPASITGIGSHSV